MPLQTAAVFWRCLAIQCVRRHYVHSFLELVSVLVLSLSIVTTNFASDPTFEPGRKQEVGAMRAWRAHRGRDSWQRRDHPKHGGGYAALPKWLSPLSPEGTHDVPGGAQRDKVLGSTTAAPEGEAKKPKAVHYSPAIPKYDQLIASAFPHKERINYTDDYYMVHACSLVEFEACVHFTEGKENELAYRLHYFESDNPGDVGLGIGFHHPEEFYFEPEMDRPLWGAVYVAQNAINLAYIATKHEGDNNNITVKPFPSPEFPENVKRYRYGLFWLVVMVFLYPTWRLLYRLCDEIQNGLREYQLLMGLNNCFYWTGHFLCALCFFAVHSACCVYSTTVYNTVETHAPYLDRTDPFLVFITFLILSTQHILLAMTISCLFPWPYAATACSVVVFVVLPFLVLNSLGALNTLAEFVFGNRNWMLLSSVLPTVAAYNVLIILGIQNDFEDGATWRKTLHITLGLVNVTVVDIWVVCAVVTVLMILLVGYLSNVLPWNAAIPLDPLFPFQRNYWNPPQDTARRETIFPVYYDPRFEPAPRGAKTALHIQGLSVRYGNNEALKRVTLQTYHKQATVLVGRNGAGKTTLLNVIVGLQKPTSGVVKVYGREVATQTDMARVFLSYCPQRDMFFPDMTVWEHLLYFGVLKRMSRASLKAAAEEALVIANVEVYARTLVADLKRQQRKRLSIAIAFISKPMLVVIDEPTAALEFADARNVWETLLRVRRHCGLLLSTHNMTEADVLADRVIALSAGIVVCNASPTHLKNLYGVGYKISLTKSSSLPFHHRHVLSVVKKCAPEAEMLSDSPKEAVIALHTVFTRGFDSMFRELESGSSQLGIKSIGLSVSTLKDIYLRMTLASASLKEMSMAGQQLPGNLSTLLSSRGEGTTMWGRAQVYLMERVLFTQTLWQSVVLSRVLPVFVLVLGLFSMSLFAGPPRRLNATGSVIRVPVSLYALYPGANVFLDDDAKARQGVSPFYEFLVKDNKGVLHRYNGTAADSLLMEALEDYIQYTSQYVLGAVFRGEEFEAWFNPYAIMSQPLAFDLVSSAVLAYRTRSYWARFHTTLMVHVPKNREVESALHDDLMGTADTIIHDMARIWALVGPLGMALVVCSFLAFSSAESSSGFMQLQLMTGISGWLHCLLNLLFDMVTFVWIALPVSLSFVLFYRLGRGSYKAIVMVFTAFGALAIFSALLIAYSTRSTRRAYATALIFFGALGTMAMEATVYLAKHGHDLGFLCTMLAPCAMPMAVIKVMALEWAQRACFVMSQRRIEETTVQVTFCRKIADYEWIYQEHMFAGLLKMHVDMCCSGINGTSPVSWHALQMTGLGVGMELYFFMAQSVLLFVYISCRNSGSFFRLASIGTPNIRQKGIDIEVAKERTAVRHAREFQLYSRYALVAEEVHKWYDENYAVGSFNLALPQDECFGLLGVYGCGKSSVAQMLAGLTIMSLGECHMDDAKLSDSPRAWQSHLGYCPEEDALMNVFTAYEILELFARLRGVPEDKVERVVECLACITDLGDCAKQLCGTYSAGSRRKLSVAVALIGLPRVIILDDATRGIDLGGREMIYEALRDITRVSASAIIMTSRSTEECQMACTRVGVMAGGEVKVLGSVARLRELFGTGFTLTLELAETVSSYAIDAVDKSVIAAFRGAQKADCREGVFVYYVTESLPWSEVFTRVERLRKLFWLDSVLIADSSLEELFLCMGRAEMAEDGAVAKRAAKDASYPTYGDDPWGREAQQKYGLLQTVREARKKEKQDGKLSKSVAPP